MRRRAVILSVLVASLAGAPTAPAWTWPADGPVLQAFQFGKNPYEAGQHRGLDVGGLAGAPVGAPASGTVTFAGSVPGGGLTVTLRTAEGYAVTLVHLGSLGLRRGATVAEGSTVGTIGPTGAAEHAVPYVHLGVRVASAPEGYVDPIGLLPARGAVPEASPPAPESPAPAAPAEPAPSGGLAEGAPPAAVEPVPAAPVIPQPSVTPASPPAAGGAAEAEPGVGTPERPPTLHSVPVMPAP
ncbi:MAG: M23 family metallopeptidase, partial [Actinobacteria bacterium]|nr:M23 family metallopeptidase [Actinomycetota bacterium]